MGKLSDEEKMGVKAGMVVAGILSCCRRATRAEIKPAMRHRLDATQVFNGADSVFRGILVPVFGLKAQLLRRDARVLAEESTKGLTEEQKAAVVASFNEGVAKKTN